MVMRKWLLLVIQFMLVVSSTHQLSECVLVHSRQPKFLWFFFFLGGGVGWWGGVGVESCHFRQNSLVQKCVM